MSVFKKTLLWGLCFAGLLTCAFFFFSHSQPTAPEILQPEKTVVAPPPAATEISVTAVGDVMLARKLNKLMARNGVSYPFAKTADLLSTADIAFANLESPISSEGSKLPGKGIWFRADPRNAPALAAAGFDLLSLANNHALDYQDAAFLETIDILDNLQIGHVGGGKNIAAARAPKVIMAKGVTAVFLAYSEMADISWSSQYPRQLRATEDRPGIAPLVGDEIISDIQAAQQQGELVFVSLHWGEEYQHQPKDSQRELAHQLIDAGADVILGHHPHCIQGVERYHGGLIAYSLGNFVFDQNQSDDTKSGLLLQIKCDQQGWREASFLPVYVNDGQPIIAEGIQTERILSQFQSISLPLGSELVVADGQVVMKNDDL